MPEEISTAEDTYQIRSNPGSRFSVKRNSDAAHPVRKSLQPQAINHLKSHKVKERSTPSHIQNSYPKKSFSRLAAL